MVLRLLLAVTFAVVLVLTLAGPGAATFPGRNGRIVFASARPDRPGEGNSEIYELDAATGAVRDLSRTVQYDDGELAVSPDGTRIAFARAPIRNPDADPYVDALPEPRVQLWVMNRDGSEQQRIGDLDFSAVSTIAWSGDGRSIAFLAESAVNSANHLWTAGADGSALREVTSFPTAGVRWAPDGSELAFVGWQDPAWDVGFVGADGAALRWMPTTPGTVPWAGMAPAWSPDGKELAFVGRAGSSSSSALFLVSADGSGERTLTSVESVSDLQWLPSGEIGFVERDSTNPRESGSHVNVIRPDGSGLRTVASQATPQIAWAPSGDRFAFVRQTPAARLELVVDSLDGSVRVLPLPGLLAQVGNNLRGGPAWSPSSASLYVAGVAASADTELYSVTPQGDDLQQLTRNTLNDGDPSWSPDGQRIVFTRETKGRRGNLLSSLWVMAADGSHPRPLTKPGSYGSPSWAPDNIHLAVALSGRIDRVAVLDTRTGRTRLLVSEAGAPAWSPDGRLIAFLGSGSVRVVRPDGTGERSLFDRSELERGTRLMTISGPTWSPDGRQIAFTLFRYGKLNSYGERQLVVPRTGGTPRELSCGPSSAPPGPVRWSPDRTALVASSGGEVWVCPLYGSAPYQLAQGTDPDWQPDGVASRKVYSLSSRARTYARGAGHLAED